MNRAITPGGTEGALDNTDAPVVLLVDDNDATLCVGETALTAAGFHVVEARGPVEALARARAHRPDVVVSGSVLRDLDGYTLSNLFHCDPAFASVPAILISPSPIDAAERELAACAGAVALVERTSNFGAELDAVRRVVRDAIPRPSISDPAACEQHRQRMVSCLSQLLSRMRRAESRYRALLDHAKEAIAVLTPEGVVLEVNREWEEICQLPRERLIGRHIREFAARGHEEDNVETFRRLVDAGGGRSPIVPIARADGSPLFIEFSTARLNIDGEEMVFSIGRDVTDTIDARSRLEAGERKYRLLVENIPDVVWLATLDGQVTFMSSRVEAICGFTPTEVVAASPSFWFDRIHGADVEGVRRAYGRLATDRTYEAEYRWQRKDGQWIWIRANAVLTVDPDGRLLAEGTFADVSDRKRLEDQVRQSQKMEAIGQLTGGIAHDFNNILAVILGNGRLLLDELPERDPRRADALAVLEAGERAAALTRQLLIFSRRQIVRPERLNLNDLVQGLDKMLQRVIGEDIELSLKVAKHVGSVLADAGEIEQVVMNLVVNARDAMPQGGHLTIETADVELDAEYAAGHAGVAPGRYVRLSVTDTGHGMDAETKRRAFEPFFTTKDNGRGTGLGLSTCYGIVQRCGGHISVYSELGHGTVFKVYLPRVERRTARQSGPVAATPEATGTETVLVVEDDDKVRRTIHRVLAARGYQVLDSSGSTEAVAICERHAGPIDLVISDMVMPGLNGPDTVLRIHDLRPAAKVLFMSGYSDHALLRGGSTEVGVNFIQKPFTPQALSAKVREVLDGG